MSTSATTKSFSNHLVETYDVILWIQRSGMEATLLRVSFPTIGLPAIGVW